MASSPRHQVYQRIFAALAFVLLGSAAFAQPSPPAQRQPVLVELFTSEGCSDCPPADALLARLDTAQFVPGAQAIVLSEHVTYWNHLGWRDPFSFDAMSERQSQYARRLALDDVYTPQMVVDGTQQFVGSDAAALTHAIARAATQAKPQLSLQNAHLTGSTLSFSVRGQANTGAALVVALAEDATHSEVTRGENAGRILHHVAVARVLKEYDSKFADGRTIQLAVAATAPTIQTSGPLRLVVFLADRQTGHVVAVTEQAVSR
jgi:hypothetical protein